MLFDKGKNRIISVNDDVTEITFEQDAGLKGVSTIVICKEVSGYEVLSSSNLIKCADCGHHVSVHSSSCISCGCPIQYSVETYFNVLVAEYIKQKAAEKVLRIARSSLYYLLKLIYIRKYEEEQKRLALLKKKKEIIARLRDLSYNNLSSLSVYTSLETLEKILSDWTKIVEEKRLRQEAIDFIPEVYRNYLSEKKIDFSKYSYEDLRKLSGFCIKNENAVDDLIKQAENASLKSFCKIADGVLSEDYKGFSNKDERLKYWANTGWNSYLRFLYIPDNYSNVDISVGFVINGDLIPISYIRLIAQKVAEKISDIQRRSVVINKTNNEEFEKHYFSYLKILGLTDYQARKQVLRDYCIYTVLKSVVPEFKNKYTSDMFSIPLTTVFTVKQPTVIQKIEVKKDVVQPVFVKSKPVVYEKRIIKKNDKVIASLDGKCIKNHPTKRIDARLEIELGDGKIIIKSLLMEYCEKCNIYYINNEVFKNLIKQGVVYCNLYPDNDTYCSGCGYEGWAKQSLLNKCGYNVNASDGLTAKERQDILVNVIKNKYYTTDEIVTFLRGLIDRNRRVRDRDMSEAISKWQKDILFLINLRRFRW